MKFQELLQSVDFKKVALAFERMYPDDKHMLSFLKCHYDILCHITPIYDENANAQECRISYIYDEVDNKSYLSAFPLEGDKWSVSLCKKVIVDHNVTATQEEIVACCLWHTSFWGYTEEQLSEIINKIVDEKLSQNKNYVFTSTAKYRALVVRLKKIIKKALKYIIETIVQSRFEVFGTELEFGEKGKYNRIDAHRPQSSLIELEKIAP